MFEALRPEGSLVFADYIYDDPHPPGGDLHACIQLGALPPPLSLDMLKESLTGSGLSLKSAKDITPFYRLKIAQGLKDFALFLRQTSPDATTKPLIRHETATFVPLGAQHPAGRASCVG